MQPEVLDIPAVTALLPLFHEKADSTAMITNGIDIIKSKTEYLNPGQIPVMTCDRPIFSKAKFIQWTWPLFVKAKFIQWIWPLLYGEDKLVVMFDDLHTEMALWKMVGDYIDVFCWTAVLMLPLLALQKVS